MTLSFHLVMNIYNIFLICLGKSSMDGTPPAGPSPIFGQLIFVPQPTQTTLLHSQLLSPTSGGVVLCSKLVDERCQVQTPVGISSQPFGVFRVFFRNSRKNRLGSLRRISMEDILPIIPGPTSGSFRSSAVCSHCGGSSLHVICCTFMCLDLCVCNEY